jgi:hypothetical protein
MNCATHPDTEAVGACVACGTGVCIACRQTIDDRTYCQACAGKASAGAPAYLPREQAPGAVIALVLGIVGLMTGQLGIILGPLAIYYAVKAKRAVAENPLLEGRGMATAGYVLGIIATVLGTIGTIWMIVFFTVFWI